MIRAAFADPPVFSITVGSYLTALPTDSAIFRPTLPDRVFIVRMPAFLAEACSAGTGCHRDRRWGIAESSSRLSS